MRLLCFPLVAPYLTHDHALAGLLPSVRGISASRDDVRIFIPQLRGVLGIVPAVQLPRQRRASSVTRAQTRARALAFLSLFFASTSRCGIIEKAGGSR